MSRSKSQSRLSDERLAQLLAHPWPSVPVEEFRALLTEVQELRKTAVKPKCPTRLETVNQHDMADQAEANASGNTSTEPGAIRRHAAHMLALYGEDDGARLLMRCADRIHVLLAEIDRLRAALVALQDLPDSVLACTTRPPAEDWDGNAYPHDEATCERCIAVVEYTRRCAEVDAQVAAVLGGATERLSARSGVGERLSPPPSKKARS